MRRRAPPQPAPTRAAPYRPAANRATSAEASEARAITAQYQTFPSSRLRLKGGKVGAALTGIDGMRAEALLITL